MQILDTEKMNVPPIAITFMLACYYAADPEEYLGYSHWNSSAGTEWRSWLKANNLIDDNEKATDRGKAWVAYICSTPLPVMYWRPGERDSVTFDPSYLASKPSDTEPDLAPQA